MKYKKLINIKRFFEYYTVSLLLSIFLLGNYSASYYNEHIVNFATFKMPYGLKLGWMDANYHIEDSLTGLWVIMPDAYPFYSKDLPYVKQLLGYCVLKDRLAVFVRTQENDIKIITLNGKTQPLPFDERFNYKVYSPQEFYNDLALFPSKYSYYIGCISLRGTPNIVSSWVVIGWGILFLLFSWVLYKVYRLLKKKNQNNFPPTKKK